LQGALLERFALTLLLREAEAARLTLIDNAFHARGLVLVLGSQVLLYGTHLLVVALENCWRYY
jgi:hypothetical protein